ncbi:hypothetical protein MES5069_1260009 [Mesorhizobium escarrei]|uniref:Uncharacterized protein n=1 Tax=Mesorhizobium escarrei TaxID=666018 RepID=A0ABN8JFI0_9HYPH|nr:hypothetical protein MES5069_1260009 [Mesorhizobium escarrei]
MCTQRAMVNGRCRTCATFSRGNPLLFYKREIATGAAGTNGIEIHGPEAVSAGATRDVPSYIEPPQMSVALNPGRILTPGARL